MSVPGISWHRRTTERGIDFVLHLGLLLEPGSATRWVSNAHRKTPLGQYWTSHSTISEVSTHNPKPSTRNRLTSWRFVFWFWFRRAVQQLTVCAPPQPALPPRAPASRRTSPVPLIKPKSIKPIFRQSHLHQSNALIESEIKDCNERPGNGRNHRTREDGIKQSDLESRAVLVDLSPDRRHCRLDFRLNAVQINPIQTQAVA